MILLEKYFSNCEQTPLLHELLFCFTRCTFEDKIIIGSIQIFSHFTSLCLSFSSTPLFWYSNEFHTLWCLAPIFCFNTKKIYCCQLNSGATSITLVVYFTSSTSMIQTGSLKAFQSTMNIFIHLNWTYFPILPVRDCSTKLYHLYAFHKKNHPSTVKL